MTGVARANFNCATEIVNNGATIANDTEYALVRQRASGYLMDAKDLLPENFAERSFFQNVYAGAGRGVSVYGYETGI